MYCIMCQQKVTNKDASHCPHCGSNLYDKADKGKPVNLITAYISVFKRMFDWRGRSSWKEFVYAYLMHFIVSLMFLMFVLNNNNLRFVFMFYSQGMFFPFLALWVRRAHDTGRPFRSLAFCSLSMAVFIASKESSIFQKAIGEYTGATLADIITSKSNIGVNPYGPDPEGKEY